MTVENGCECPRCIIGECTITVNPRTGEEDVLCQSCGYQKGVNIRRDEKGEIILKDSTKPLEKDNIYYDKYEVQAPYGMASYMPKIGGIGHMFPLRTFENYLEFKESIEKSKDDLQQAKVSRFTEEKIEVEILV